MVPARCEHFCWTGRGYFVRRSEANLSVAPWLLHRRRLSEAIVERCQFGAFFPGGNYWWKETTSMVRPTNKEAIAWWRSTRHWCFKNCSMCNCYNERVSTLSSWVLYKQLGFNDVRKLSSTGTANRIWSNGIFTSNSDSKENETLRSEMVPKRRRIRGSIAMLLSQWPMESSSQYNLYCVLVTCCAKVSYTP